MLAYLLRRVLYTLPIMAGVALVCFALVHLAPGDPLVSILPADASEDLQNQLRTLYGFDRSLPEQFFGWVWRALQGDLGTSIASNRPVTTEVMTAVVNTLRLAVVATLIGFFFGCLFGFVAGYFRNSWVDRGASLLSVLGVSVPHYWLGMVLVIVFAAQLNWLPATGAGPGGSDNWVWNWEHVKHLLLPAITMSVIPMGIVARTVRALVAEILAQEFVVGLRAKGLTHFGVFRHVVKNAAPTALAVMGLCSPGRAPASC
jgi:peptide/nickel transport system permease protein